MKKIALTSVVLFLHISFFAQNSQSAKQPILTQKNELGINLFSVQYFSQLVGYGYTKENVLPGIYYKRHFGQNSLRFSFDFYKSDVNEISTSKYKYNYGTNIGVITKEQLKIGYQRQFGKRRFVPFVYSDLFFSYNSNVYKNDAVYSSNFFNLGIANGAGLKYQLNKNLSLSYEFAFIFSYDPNYNLVENNHFIDSMRESGTLNFFPVRHLGLSYSF